MRSFQVAIALTALIVSATVLANCSKRSSSDGSSRRADSDEASRIRLAGANTLALPEGFTVEAAGDRSTTLRLRGWTCKRDFFDEIRASLSGHLMKDAGFTTLECVSPGDTIAEGL
jgi:hypothetical protein